MVQQVINQNNIPANMTYLVLLNGVYIDQDQRLEKVLKEDDTVAIWPPVAGG